MSHQEQNKTSTETTQPHVDTDEFHTAPATSNSNASSAQSPNPQAGKTSPNDWTIIRPIGPLPHNYTLNSTLFGSAAHYAVRQAMLRNDFHQALVREGLEKDEGEGFAACVDGFPYREVPKGKAKGNPTAKSPAIEANEEGSSASLHGSRQQAHSGALYHDDLDGSGGGWQRVPARPGKDSRRYHGEKSDSKV